MTSELEEAIEAGMVDSALADSLQRLAPGEHCTHKSWGFGKVSEWRLQTRQIIIDFESKRGHPMQVEYAVETLQVVPAGHVRVRIFQDATAVRSEAGQSPVEFVRKFLQDHGGKATVEQFSQALVPAVFDAAGFKRWWESTKKKLKTNGHFRLPSKKTEPIEVHEAMVSQHQGLLLQFHEAHHMRDQVVAADQIIKSLEDFSQEEEELRAVVRQMEEAASKGRRLQAVQAVELLLARDEICTRYEGLCSSEESVSVAEILSGEEDRLPALFSALPASKQRRALEAFPQAFGEDWKQHALDLAQKVGWRTVVDIARLFEKSHALAEFQKAVEVGIAERSVSSEILYWLCKERGDRLQELFHPGLLIAVLITLENDQLGEGKRSARLHDLLMDDSTLLQNLLEGADRQMVRDVMRRLIMSPAFTDINRRSLLARIIKLHPEMQSMIRGEPEERQETLVVSWASLEKRKAEYDDLVSRQIPQNIKDIQIAREYGDLRENFEFKSAKEQQAVLSRQKSDLEWMLSHARGTNFETPDTGVVSIGTIVVLEEVATGAQETYTLLGAWDSSPDHGIVSYKAGVGQALLGKRVDEVVEVPGVEGARPMRIVSISAFKNLELLHKIHESSEVLS